MRRHAPHSISPIARPVISVSGATTQQRQQFAPGYTSPPCTGGDERHEEMSSDTSVRALVERYLLEETPLKAPKTQQQDAAYARHLIAAWGDVGIADITPRAVAALHRQISARAPVLANRVLSFISQVCKLAERDDRRGPNSNPTTAIRRNREPRRTNFLEPAMRERFLAAASAELAAGTISRSAWTLICLMMLAGLRWSDARLLRWDEVDEAKGVLRFHPRGDLRAENKGGEQRVVPLSDEALDLVLKSPRVPQCPYVAAAPRTGLPYTDIRKPLKRICERAGVKLTPHWLRHTYGTAAAETGLSPDEIAAVLGHSSNASAGRYVHLAGRAARSAAQRAGAASVGRLQ